MLYLHMLYAAGCLGSCITPDPETRNGPRRSPLAIAISKLG